MSNYQLRPLQPSAEDSRWTISGSILRQSTHTLAEGHKLNTASNDFYSVLVNCLILHDHASPRSSPRNGIKQVSRFELIDALGSCHLEFKRTVTDLKIVSLKTLTEA
jgi:hypothetical protein